MAFVTMCGGFCLKTSGTSEGDRWRIGVNGVEVFAGFEE